MSVAIKQMKLIRQYVLNSSAASSAYGKELVQAIDEKLQAIQDDEDILMPTMEELEEIA